MNFDILMIDMSIYSQRTYVLEIGGHVCIDAHTDFDIISDHSVHTHDTLKVSKSIQSAVFSPTFTHPLLAELFLASTCKDVSK